jgi:hypothetical protein
MLLGSAMPSDNYFLTWAASRSTNWWTPTPSWSVWLGSVAVRPVVGRVRWRRLRCITDDCAFIDWLTSTYGISVPMP